MTTIRKAGLCACFWLLAAAPDMAHGGEAGAGLYIPGSVGLGAGLTPPPGFYFTQGFLVYDGQIGVAPEGGALRVNARKSVFVALGNLLWVVPAEVLGGRLGISATLPYANFTRLGVSVPALGSTAVEGWGIGDLSLKAQLGWAHGDFAHTISLTGWLPTGRYDTGLAPNAGKNHAGANVAWAFTQIWKEIGVEASASLGITAELENTATRYRNGVALNLDAAIGKIVAPGLTLGAAGYISKQISDDKGAGAALGAFRGQAFGLGPAVSYSTVIGQRPLSFALRHYQEFGVKNRFEGHMTTLTMTTRF